MRVLARSYVQGVIIAKRGFLDIRAITAMQQIEPRGWSSHAEDCEVGTSAPSLSKISPLLRGRPPSIGDMGAKGAGLWHLEVAVRDF
jgi:hypothetical protein